MKPTDDIPHDAAYYHVTIALAFLLGIVVGSLLVGTAWGLMG